MSYSYHNEHESGGGKTKRMKDAKVAQIIQQALIDNGRDTFVGTDVEGYESSCSIEELARLIVNRLYNSGVLDEKETVCEYPDKPHIDACPFSPEPKV